MGPFPCPTLAFLSPHFDLQREGLRCLLSDRRSFLQQAGASDSHPAPRPVSSCAVGTEQGRAALWEVSHSEPPQEVTAPVLAGMCPIPNAASRDVLPDTLLALRRLNPAEKKRGLGRQVGIDTWLPCKGPHTGRRPHC